MRLPLPQYIRFAMTLSVSYPVSLLLFRSFSLLLTIYQHPRSAFTDLNDLVLMLITVGVYFMRVFAETSMKQEVF